MSLYVNALSDGKCNINIKEITVQFFLYAFWYSFLCFFLMFNVFFFMFKPAIILHRVFWHIIYSFIIAITLSLSHTHTHCNSSLHFFFKFVVLLHMHISKCICLKTAQIKKKRTTTIKCTFFSLLLIFFFYVYCKFHICVSPFRSRVLNVDLAGCFGKIVCI